MTFDFDSQVEPQVSITETGLDDIQSALQAYNNHRHAVASTGNPFSMGIVTGASIKDEGNKVVPSGTVINSLDQATITMSDSAKADATGITLEVDGKILLYNCDLTDGSNVVNLNSQIGFMDPDILDRALSEDLNGSITNTNAPDGDGSPREFYLMMSPFSPYYVSSISLLKDVDSGSNSVKLEFVIYDIDSDDGSTVDEHIIWSEDVVNTLTRYTKEFVQQTTSSNTLLKSINSSSSVYSRLVLRLKETNGSVNSLGYNIRLRKVVL